MNADFIFYWINVIVRLGGYEVLIYILDTIILEWLIKPDCPCWMIEYVC